jgi:hypothetical protein
MGDDRDGANGDNGAGHVTAGEDPRAVQAAERERQARETLRLVRENVGDLGARVRKALDHATALWEGAQPAAVEAPPHVPGEDDAFARSLARRWVQRDFLVDPDLPRVMTVLGVRRAAVWRVELRERGEARTLAEGHEPYRGQRPGGPGPVLPVWDYDLPITPEIESGERPERVSGTEAVAACHTCNGTGHRPCRACEGKGFYICPTCHGRSRLPCRRCRGRGRIEDPTAVRRAGAAKGYWQVRAERLAADASDRIADFAERLRQDYGVPLPPSAQWAWGANPSVETIPCPDCVNGSVPCECGNGKRACETCQGTGSASCGACSGTGKTVRFHQIIRRFDTRFAQRVLPVDDPSVADWLRDEMVQRAAGEDVWESGRDVLSDGAPGMIPNAVWQAARDFAQNTQAGAAPSAQEGGGGERRVIERRVRVSRIAVARVEYAFAGKEFAFVAVGRSGAERFWASAFPPRWSRVGRFLKALTRDLQRERPRDLAQRDAGAPSNLEEYRQRRAHNGSEPGDDPPSTV